jgi:hypothetical protein
MAYLWAAYKRGVFAHLPEFTPELSPDDFRKLMFAVIGNVLQGGGDAWMFYSKSIHPVGLVIGFASGKGMEPHVFWFPEATPRNRVECALKWLVEMKSKYALFLWVKEADWNFYRHLCKYGAIREVGKYRDFPGGGDAMLFQGCIKA